MTVLVSLVICHDVDHKRSRKTLFAKWRLGLFFAGILRFLPLNFLIKLYQDSVCDPLIFWIREKNTLKPFFIEMTQ